MAKNFPYFKFTVADWLTGDIVYESFSVQGLFANICALYWQRDGVLSIDDINKRFKNPPELEQLNGRFFSLNEGSISVAFLDEQFAERKHLSTENSKNGKKSAASKALKTKESSTSAERTVNDNSTKFNNKEKRREEKKKENNKEKGFDEKLKLNFSILDGDKIYGNDHQISQGGLSEMAILQHCKNEGIVYEK